MDYHLSLENDEENGFALEFKIVSAGFWNIFLEHSLPLLAIDPPFSLIYRNQASKSKIMVCIEFDGNLQS